MTDEEFEADAAMVLGDLETSFVPSSSPDLDEYELAARSCRSR